MRGHSGIRNPLPITRPYNFFAARLHLSKSAQPCVNTALKRSAAPQFDANRPIQFLWTVGARRADCEWTLKLLLSVYGFDCVLLDEAPQRFHVEPQRSTNLDAGNLPQPGLLVDGVHFEP